MSSKTSNGLKPDESHIEPIPANVKEDPRLESSEKELTLRTASDRDRFTLHADQRGAIRRVMRHPHIQVESCNVHEGQITSVRATLPRGLVLIKGEPREESGMASIIAQHTLKNTSGED